MNEATKPTRTCLKCDGKGRVSLVYSYTMKGIQINTLSNTIPCYICKGTGKVEDR